MPHKTISQFTGPEEEYVSNKDTAKTITGTISSLFANLSAQKAATVEANTSQVNTSLQQLKNNNA
jgi:hypothetical protein